MTSGLVDRHIAFLEALRGAGLSVSLAEDLDAVAALSALPLGPAEHRPRRVRRHAGQEAGAAADLRDAVRRLLPGARRGGRAGRRGRGTPTTRAGPRQRRGAGRVPRAAARGARRRRRGAAGPAGRRDGGPVRRDARPRSRAVQLVGVHRAPAGRADAPHRQDRRRAARRGAHRGGGRPGGRPPGRRVHPAGRGRRAPPDRRGEGPRPRRQRRGEARASTGSTSPPPARPTWRRCAARSTRSPAGWRPG